MTATVKADVRWSDATSQVKDRLADHRREIAALTAMVKAWALAADSFLNARPRWLLMTPNLAVGLRNRWKPWWSVVRNGRTGNRHVGCGLMLLSMSVVIPGRVCR